jgi:hypothetical protein
MLTYVWKSCGSGGPPRIPRSRQPDIENRDSADAHRRRRCPPSPSPLPLPLPLSETRRHLGRRKPERGRPRRHDHRHRWRRDSACILHPRCPQSPRLPTGPRDSRPDRRRQPRAAQTRLRQIPVTAVSFMHTARYEHAALADAAKSGGHAEIFRSHQPRERDQPGVRRPAISGVAGDCPQPPRALALRRSPGFDRMRYRCRTTAYQSTRAG